MALLTKHLRRGRALVPAELSSERLVGASRGSSITDRLREKMHLPAQLQMFASEEAHERQICMSAHKPFSILLLSRQAMSLARPTWWMAERRFPKPASPSNDNGVDEPNDRSSTERLIVTNPRAEQALLTIGTGE